MKDPTLIVRIPEPCHEDWNKMTPDDKGRFCASCSKSVFDFSTKTDTEIKNILIENKDKKVCGHFKKSQIDRPLNITIDLSNLPKNMSITKMFGVALFLVFGTFLFSCTDINGKKVDGIETVNTIGRNEEESHMVGLIMAPIPEIKDSANAISTMTQQTVMIETYVDGGVRYEEILPQENLLVKGDTVVEDTLPAITEKIFMRGAVCISHIPAVIDSSEVQKPDSILSREVIENANIIFNKENELSVYPNPANGEFTVKYEVAKRADVRVDVYDMNGMLLKNIVNVIQQYEGRYNIPVNLTELSDGTYFVSIINNGKRFTEKLIIAR